MPATRIVASVLLCLATTGNLIAQTRPIDPDPKKTSHPLVARFKPDLTSEQWGALAEDIRAAIPKCTDAEAISLALLLAKSMAYSSHNKEDYELKSQVVFTVLKNKRVAIGTRVKLLNQIAPVEVSEREPPAAKETRADIIVLCLSTLNELQTIIKENLDAPAWMNVPLPAGVPGESGMDPAGIKDPVARKKYEDAIRNNERLAEKQRRVGEARDDSRTVQAKLARFINASYGGDFLPDEVKALIEKHVQDEDARKSLLDALLAGRATSTPPATTPLR